MMKMLRKFVDSPWVNMVSGLILIFFSVLDIYKTFGEGVGAQHGVAVYGIVQVLKTLPDLVDGMESVTKIEE